MLVWPRAGVPTCWCVHVLRVRGWPLTARAPWLWPLRHPPLPPKGPPYPTAGPSKFLENGVATTCGQKAFLNRHSLASHEETLGQPRTKILACVPSCLGQAGVLRGWGVLDTNFCLQILGVLLLAAFPIDCTGFSIVSKQRGREPKTPVAEVVDQDTNALK